MNSIRQSFLLSLYLVVSLAATMLALAETGVPLSTLLNISRSGAIFSLLPVLLTLPIAALAYRWVENQGCSISSRTASGLGLVALFAAIMELWLRDIEGRILFAGHLLVYLTWILLWQEKRSRQCGGLIALAILQVAVGCVLTTAGWFGALMVVCLALSIWTLVLMQIAEVESRYSAGSETQGESLAYDTQSLLAPGRASPLGHALVTHWPMRQVVASALLALLGSLAIGTVFFLLVPRVDFGLTAFGATDESAGSRRVTGFSDRVRLGAFGELLQSNAPAFQVRILDEGGKKIAPRDYAARFGMAEPLFRGLVLTSYSRGEWTASDFGRGRRLPSRILGDSVRQEYRIDMDTAPVLFGIGPILGGEITDGQKGILSSRATDVLRVNSDERNLGGLRYTLLAPARPRDQGDWSYWAERGGYTDYPRGLTRLESIAATVAGPAATNRQTADRLVTYLRDSGEFQYSLSGELVDPRLDPVEDFLVNRKSGHCEFFASALTLMLRAQRIPARLVNGYKGGAPNELTGWFEVQQRHAHSWTEAYIDHRWVTLDPSPAAGRAQVVDAGAPKMPLWTTLRNSSTLVWRDYIVQLNAHRQRAAIEPLRKAALVTYRNARDIWWPAAKAHVYDFATDPGRWFSWQGGLVTFVGLLIIVGLWRLGRRILLRRRRRRESDQLARGRRLHVDFYEDFRSFCRERGWDALPTQTPREFAHEVSGALRSTAPPGELLALPEELTGAYYHLRFGQQPLSEKRRRELRDRFGELRAHVLNAENGLAPEEDFGLKESYDGLPARRK